MINKLKRTSFVLIGAMAILAVWPSPIANSTIPPIPREGAKFPNNILRAILSSQNFSSSNVEIITDTMRFVSLLPVILIIICCGILVKAYIGDDENVKNNAKRSSALIGFFIALALFCDFIIGNAMGN